VTRRPVAGRTLCEAKEDERKGSNKIDTDHVNPFFSPGKILKRMILNFIYSSTSIPVIQEKNKWYNYNAINTHRLIVKLHTNMLISLT
jgi:hypothetical protein